MRILAISLITLILAACGTAYSGPGKDQANLYTIEARADKLGERRLTIGEEVSQIPFSRHLDSWGYLDDYALWVEVKPRKHYLLTLSRKCRDLKFVNAIGFKQRGLTITRSDLIWLDSPNTYTCSIDKIYELDRVKREKPEQE